MANERSRHLAQDRNAVAPLKVLPRQSVRCFPLLFLLVSVHNSWKYGTKYARERQVYIVGTHLFIEIYLRYRFVVTYHTVGAL